MRSLSWSSSSDQDDVDDSSGFSLGTESSACGITGFRFSSRMLSGCPTESFLKRSYFE